MSKIVCAGPAGINQLLVITNINYNGHELGKADWGLREFLGEHFKASMTCGILPPTHLLKQQGSL